MLKINSETKGLPKYLWLKEKIKKQIESGKLKSGQRVPSENELVHTYGLSNNTVQKAFTHLLLEGYIYREQGKGTFVKESETKEKEINIQIICNPSSSFRESNPINWFITFYILQGVVDACNKFNCRPNFADSYKNLPTNKSQGIIMVEDNPKLAEKLTEKGYAVVGAYQTPSEIQYDKVVTDWQQAAYDGTIHLLNLGHKKIGFMGNISSFPQHLRWLGCKKALEERGISFQKELIIECQGRKEDGYKAALSLLNLQKRPTAIFASTDLRALGAIKAIKEKGLRIPEDIAVVGYDDIPEASTCQPPLTTLHPPRYECGYQSVKLLKELINKEKQEPQAIILPAKLIIRKSCGAYLKGGGYA